MGDDPGLDELLTMDDDIRSRLPPLHQAWLSLLKQAREGREPGEGEAWAKKYPPRKHCKKVMER